jgi:hypothetical protein
MVALSLRCNVSRTTKSVYDILRACIRHICTVIVTFRILYFLFVI